MGQSTKNISDLIYRNVITRNWCPENICH